MAELAPFQKQTLAIKGKNPLKTYSLRLGYLNHILDKAGIESDQDRQKLIEVTLGQKPEDVDMSDTVWGEVKRRVQSGVLQLTTMPLKFAQFANAFGDADWEDIEDYEKQITSLERRAQSVPKMREGYLYDVVEQVPNTLSTLGITLGVSAVTGGFAIPALASYGINIIFETGESFNAKLRDQKIDRAFASKWKGKIPEREYQENLREAKKDAALSAGSVQIALEAINPFNAVEALPMGKIGPNIVGKLAKTQSAKFGPTRALRAKIQDSPRLSKAIGVGGETVARSATEFGQEFTQNVKGDVIQQVVGTDKEVGDALGDVDYGSASYGALVAAGSAGGVTATTNVAKRVISEEAPTTSESELIRERVRQAIESGDGQRLAEELSVLRQEVAEEEEQNRQNKESVSEWRDKWRIRLAPDFLNKRQKLKKQLQIAEEEINDIANGRETDSRVDKDRTRFELRKGLSQAVENGSQKEVDQGLNVNSDNPHAKVIIDDFVKDVQYSEQYRSLSGFQNKKNYLQDWIKNKISQRITTIRELAQQGEFNVDKDYLSYVRGELSSLKEQKAFNEYLKNQALNNGLSYTSVEEYFNSLKDLDNASVSDQVWKAASVLSEVKSLFKQYQDRFLELPPSKIDAPFN